jgi:two-component system sensor histidine kinase KdpD
VSTRQSDPDRPSPDVLLHQAQEGRGRLKIFLGAAPGVGKTYAMLEDARRKQAEGVDVVIGIVESHGRSETEALTHGLKAVARKSMEYRERTLPEMDLDALLARKPQLALVDELAHTNVPGSRHGKRFQDVEELLAAGIDVYTTLNIQHLESLNDIVARITRIRVRETLPDKVLELADEIELVDLTPDDLIQRLREGKVYLRDQASRAVNHFFTRGNLTALRELALRAAAERVDRQMLSYMAAHAIPGPWPTQDRIMVCVDESPGSENVVRAAKRMADRQKAPWIAVHVETHRDELMSEEAKDRLVASMLLAEQLGAEAVMLPSDAPVADELLNYAVSRNVQRVILGRPRRFRLRRLLRLSVTDELVRRGADYDVTVVAATEVQAPAPEPFKAAAPPRTFELQPYAEATGIVLGATVVSFGIDMVLPLHSLSLVYLTGVLIAAIRLGLWPSIYASFLSFVVYNFLFTPPRLTLNITRSDDAIAIIFFLIVATLVGNLTARLRAKAVATRLTARRTENLYEFSRRVAGAANIEDVSWAVVSHVATTLQCQSVILLPRGGVLEIAAGFPPEDTLTPANRAAADWAWEHNKPAGWSSETLPASDWLFVPMVMHDKPIGLVGVSFPGHEKQFTTEQRRLLMAVVDQAALAVERTNLARDIEDQRLLTETEALRQALLSSISHDLRTPLVSIIGSVTTLQEYDATLTPGFRGELMTTIHEEAERLNRFVQNLLDMIRLGYGGVGLRTDWIDLHEIIGRARQKAARQLEGHDVVIDMAEDVPLLQADGVLIEQVFANLLDNAAKYSPAAAPVNVTARRDGEVAEIKVTDQGPGIPPEHRDAVFDMFFRVRAGDRQPAGTGLGLAICRGFVEAHGGTIRAEPGPDGVGASIVVRLPLAAGPDVPAEEDAA